MYGREGGRSIPGNTLALKKDEPYRGLEQFGVSFLNNFEGVQAASDMLRSMTVIDTPSVATDDKQRNAREYELVEVLTFLAGRSAMIVLLFDASNFVFSDEYRDILIKLSPFTKKVRIILNNSDQVDRQKLMRVHASLLWNISHILLAHEEPPRIYICTFNYNRPLVHDDNAPLFEAETRDLMRELLNVSTDLLSRQIDELAKRARKCKLHAYIIGYLREQMPSIGKNRKQNQMVEDLDSIFRQVSSRYQLPLADFPDAEKFRNGLRTIDVSKLQPIRMVLLEQLESVLSLDIPRLLETIPEQNADVDGSVAVDLLTKLGPGMRVLKHGRSGRPKMRLLKSNGNITRLHWSDNLESQDLSAESKSVNLYDVSEVRYGTDPDPTNPSLCGTATLRKHCSPEDLETSFSLILPDRTFDIQCMNKYDCDVLVSGLREHCAELKVKGNPTPKPKK